jgi:5-(aminomethyl)-3-furanmethanol phosphate kinase
VLTVVKVGGGIGDDALPAVCAELGRRPVLVVPGGGRFADAVREADHRFPLQPETAHRMAILGMEQFGHLLLDLIPGAELCTDLERIATDRTSVLLPAGLPLDLPASWDVTSDSIAAWVARKAGAGRLVLVKAGPGVDEYFATAIEGAPFATSVITPEELLDDPLLPSPHG